MRKIIIMLLGIALLLSINTVSATDTTSGLVNQYNFENSAVDSSGNGRTGTLNSNAAYDNTQALVGSFSLFSGTTGGFNFPTGSSLAAGNYTIAFWVRPTGFTSDRSIVSAPTMRFFINAQGGSAWTGGADGTAFTQVTFSSPVNFNQWTLFAMTYNSAIANLTIYSGGSLQESNSVANVLGSGNIYIGSFNGIDTMPNAYYDAAVVYNRTLTAQDILALNSTIIPTSNATFLSAVNLTNPANNSNFQTMTGVTFNATAINGTSSGTIVNSTFYLYNGGTTTTFTTSVANNRSSFTVGLIPEGDYSWNIQMCASSGVCLFAPANFTFRYDATAPAVRVILPVNASYIYPHNASNAQFNLNITADTSGLSAVFYNTSWDSTVRLVTNGALNVINLTNIFGRQTIFAFANDTSGNLRLNTSSIIIPRPTFNTTTTILQTETFSLNSSYFNGLTATSIVFIYNGTSYSPTIAIDSAGNTVATTIIIIPTNLTGNVKFFWNTTLSDGTRLNSSIYNQTISSFTIDNCAVNKNLIINFTNFDQDNLLQLPGNTFNMQARIGNADLSQYIQYATNATNALNLQFCMDINLTTSYRMDVIMQSNRNASYFTQFYNIQNYTLNNLTINQSIPLYNLLVTSGATCNINVRDDNFLPLQNVLVRSDRQYIQNGNFLTVEIPATDSLGSTVGHFILNNQIYNVYITQNGQILASFLNIQPVNDPTTGSCTLNFQVPGEDTNPATLDGANNIIYTARYNDTSQTYYVDFISFNGTAITVVLNGSVGNTQVCSGSLTAASGTVQCVIPAQYQNQTVTIQAFSNGNLVFTDYVNVGFTSRTLSGLRYFLVGLLLPAAVLMAAGSASMGLILFVFGIGISAFIFLLDTQSLLGAGSFIVWIAIAAIILIIKILKGGQKNG